MRNPTSRDIRLCAVQTAVVTVALCLGGCGAFDRNDPGEATRFVTRGQHPRQAAVAHDRSETSQELLQRARGMYGQGRLREAETAVRGALEADPLLTDALELQARIALDLGDREGYRSALGRMLQAHPQSAPVQNSAGKRLVEHGHWDEGVQGLRKALELAPRNAEYARDLAAACLETTESDTARQVLTEALRWNPHDATIPVALARFHESAENWGEAAAYYGAALAADRHNRAWRRRQARCLYRLEEYARACEAWLSCIEGDASALSLAEYAELGDACLRTGDAERAQMAYDHVSRHSPVRSREVELLRAICAVRRSDSRSAQRILSDALSRWPGDDDLLGLVEVVRGMKDEG